jgi:hypothetical protein
MHYLGDQREQAIAILHQNFLLDIYGEKLLGVVLGHCVFDRTGKARGKYFRHALYDMDGRLLAKEQGVVTHLDIDDYGIMEAAWQIVNGITDHNCQIIVPLELWSGVPVSEHFSGIAIFEEDK